MDDLTYHYDETSGRLNHNQLQYVTDAVTTNTGNTADIKTQASGYYAYDAIGNLVREGLTSGEHQLIEWNVYGKIRQITKKNGSTQLSLIQYTYDVSGNRIGKKVQTGSGTPVESWYVRDASGNVMAIYEKENPAVNNGELSQIEVPLYGSSRLGLWRPMRALEGENWELFDTDPAPGTSGIREEEFVRGRTQYELSNHLGNVLVTISDNRVPVDDGTYEALLQCPTCLPGYPCIPCRYVCIRLEKLDCSIFME